MKKIIKLFLLMMLFGSFLSINDVLAQTTTINPSLIKALAPSVAEMSDEEIRAAANQLGISPSLTPATIRSLAKAVPSMDNKTIQTIFNKMPSMNQSSSEALAREISSMSQSEIAALSNRISSMSDSEINSLFNSINSTDDRKKIKNLLGGGSSSSAGGGSKVKIDFSNPLSKGSVEELLAGAMAVIQGIVGILAVFMIVIGGVMWIMSGTTGQTETAKKVVQAAMIGLAITLGAPALLKEIYNILGLTAKQPSEIAQKKSLYNILVDATTTVLGIVGALSILMIIIGGIMYISNQDDTAKKIIKASVIGLVIALTSLVLVKAIASIF